ncbi:MAG: hypothetical protein R3B98_02175 [Hyphomonas sp.]
MAIDGELDLADAVDDATACVIGQSPNIFGTVTDLSPVADAAHGKGALLVSVFTEAVSLGLVTPPGEMGADIAVGEGQSIGNGLNFGGPYVGLFACREKLVRQMPGRLCGETVDADGKRGAVLTPVTRERHIRRDQGDVQYLHQFRSLRARLHGAHDAARWKGPGTACRPEP